MIIDDTAGIAEQVGSLQLRLVARVYPRGAMLFRRGQRPSGVFYLQEGEVHLSPGCESLMPERVEIGSVLGLGELLAGEKYEKSAICRSLARVTYVHRDDLLRD